MLVVTFSYVITSVKIFETEDVHFCGNLWKAIKPLNLTSFVDGFSTIVYFLVRGSKLMKLTIATSARNAHFVYLALNIALLANLWKKKWITFHSSFYSLFAFLALLFYPLPNLSSLNLTCFSPLFPQTIGPKSIAKDPSEKSFREILNWKINNI